MLTVDSLLASNTVVFFFFLKRTRIVIRPTTKLSCH